MVLPSREGGQSNIKWSIMPISANCSFGRFSSSALSP
jgi:hypothetical protein